MNSLKFHHIGIACSKITDEIEYYQLLGYIQQGEKFEDPQQGVRGLFMQNNGTLIELLEPINDKSPICSFVNKGIHMYHQGFTCVNIKDEAAILEENGAMIISSLKYAIAFPGLKVCFLIMPNQTLIELIGN